MAVAVAIFERINTQKEGRQKKGKRCHKLKTTMMVMGSSSSSAVKKRQFS